MKQFLLAIALVLMVAGCTESPDHPDAGGGIRAVYIDPSTGTPEGPGWAGGGEPWYTNGADGALLNFPLGNAVPHGATIVGFDIRWYQNTEGDGDMGAVLYRDSFNEVAEYIGGPVFIDTYGDVTVDGVSGLEVEVDLEYGYRIIVETSGTTQVCRLYDIVVYYIDD